MSTTQAAQGCAGKPPPRDPRYWGAGIAVGPGALGAEGRWRGEGEEWRGHPHWTLRYEWVVPRGRGSRVSRGDGVSKQGVRRGSGKGWGIWWSRALAALCREVGRGAISAVGGSWLVPTEGQHEGGRPRTPGPPGDSVSLSAGQSSLSSSGGPSLLFLLIGGPPSLLLL